MRTRITRGLAAALAVPALALTAACGGSDGAKDDTKPKAPAGTTAAGTPSAAPTTSAAPEATGPLTAAQMKGALLELKDLPSGWKGSAHASAEFAVKADKAECRPLAEALSAKIPGATTGPSADFALGNNASELSESIQTFGSAADATAFTEKLSAALDSCTSFTADQDGTSMKTGVEKLTAPKTAEEAIAVRLKLAVAPGVTVEPTVLVARQGSGLIRVLHLADSAKAKGDFDAFAKLAGDKLAKAAAQG
ncbi:hypothetical protein [Streptomyces sp. NPDC090025]|uniref:hypothetical protein n=1 Tax=Streptomyces sp. NPDC090025 TaxID=3365922 RepID=UPI00383766ED